MDELGLADELLSLPHSEVGRFEVPTSAGPVAVLDLTRLRTQFPFIAFMPQWDFLTFVVTQANRYPGFRHTAPDAGRLGEEVAVRLRSTLFRDIAFRGWSEPRSRSDISMVRSQRRTPQRPQT